MIGRTAVAAWLALSGSASAFTTTPATTSSFSRVGTATFATANEAAVDVSIPYDAAARLAYDDWRKEYNKGAFDAKRYEAFRANYNAITIANVSAKKKARDTGDEPRLMSMNEYGDCTAEEYQAAQEKQKEGVLDKAVEAVESQSAASTALGDAAAALAEEEEKLAKKLGYDSVEELEVAMDTMEGIAEDGSALDDGLAREARIRSAYLQWCKDNGKEPDESRFPTFSSNFLAMEEYAAEAGKEMSLNSYADLTEEEYLELTAKPEPAEPKAAPAPKPAPEPVAKEKTEAEKKAEAAATAKKKAAAEAAAKKQAEARVKEEKSAEETRKAAERERAARQAEQAKAQEKLRAENEAAAIAAAREAAEREAAQVAERRALDEKAAEIARQKAAAFEKKQRELAIQQEKIAAKTRAASKKRAPASTPILGSFFKAPAPTPKKEEVPSLNVDLSSVFKAPEAKKKETPSLDLGSVFKAPAPKRKKEAPSFGSVLGAAKLPAVKKPVAKKPAAKKTVAKKEPFSFFQSKPKAAPKPAPAPAPVAKKPAFSMFGSPKPKAKASAPTPTPAPVKAKAKPAFSMFGSPKPKAKAPAPAPAPAKVKPAFSMFGSPKPKAAAPVPAPAPAKAKPAFSMFGSPKPKAKAPAPAPAPAPKPAFSFFGSATAPAKKAPAKKAPVNTGRGRGTLMIPKKEKSNNFGFSFGGASKQAESESSIPVLSNFVQNPDGSLTGRVSGSKNYRNGQKITTSPVRRGVKAGQTVTTGSGSKYKLK